MSENALLKNYTLTLYKFGLNLYEHSVFSERQNLKLKFC